MAWGKEGSNTLTSSAGVVDVDATGTFIMAMMHDFATGGNTEVELRFDSTGGSAYARRNSSNGGSDNTAVSQASIQGHGATSDDDFHITYTVNIATEEKLMIGFGVNRNSAGAGNAPYREEFVGKYAQTSAKVETQGIIDTSGSGSYDTDTNLTALGSDVTPAAAVPFPTDVQDSSIYIETDTDKRYWYNGTYWHPRLLTRGVIAGGATPTTTSPVNTIDYITIATLGNATDFGDLTVSRCDVGGVSNVSRGVVAGGYSHPSYVDTIDYFTIGTPSNATDFGNLSEGKSGAGGVDDQSRGIFAGGEKS